METDRDDVHRVKLRAPMKKLLLAALRGMPGPRPRPLPQRGLDGSYSVVVFVPGSALASLAGQPGLTVVESANIGARLRQGPLTAVEAGLEPNGVAAAPTTRLGKAAPLRAL